jgi:hypothetical protein
VTNIRDRNPRMYGGTQQISIIRTSVYSLPVVLHNAPVPLCRRCMESPPSPPLRHLCRPPPPDAPCRLRPDSAPKPARRRPPPPPEPASPATETKVHKRNQCSLWNNSNHSPLCIRFTSIMPWSRQAAYMFHASFYFRLPYLFLTSVPASPASNKQHSCYLHFR